MFFLLTTVQKLFKKNLSRFSRVMITNVLPPFLWFTVYKLDAGSKLSCKTELSHQLVNVKCSNAQMMRESLMERRFKPQE